MITREQKDAQWEVVATAAGRYLGVTGPTPKQVSDALYEAHEYEDDTDVASRNLRAAFAKYEEMYDRDLDEAPGPELDPDALGPCGCTDYHMADCPLVTDRFGRADDDSNDPYDNDEADERRWALEN